MFLQNYSFNYQNFSTNIIKDRNQAKFTNTNFQYNFSSLNFKYENNLSSFAFAFNKNSNLVVEHKLLQSHWGDNFGPQNSLKLNNKFLSAIVSNNYQEINIDKNDSKISLFNSLKKKEFNYFFSKNGSFINIDHFNGDYVKNLLDLSKNNFNLKIINGQNNTAYKASYKGALLSIDNKNNFLSTNFSDLKLKFDNQKDIDVNYKNFQYQNGNYNFKFNIGNSLQISSQNDKINSIIYSHNTKDVHYNLKYNINYYDQDFNINNSVFDLRSNQTNLINKSSVFHQSSVIFSYSDNHLSFSDNFTEKIYTASLMFNKYFSIVSSEDKNNKNFGLALKNSDLSAYYQYNFVSKKINNLAITLNKKF